jgi:hypothetical protein
MQPYVWRLEFQSLEAPCSSIYSPPFVLLLESGGGTKKGKANKWLGCCVAGWQEITHMDRKRGGVEAHMPSASKV